MGNVDDPTREVVESGFFVAVYADGEVRAAPEFIEFREAVEGLTAELWAFYKPRVRRLLTWLIGGR